MTRDERDALMIRCAQMYMDANPNDPDVIELARLMGEISAIIDGEGE